MNLREYLQHIVKINVMYVAAIVHSYQSLQKYCIGHLHCLMHIS
jgi:hypothetical protein